MSEDYRTKLGTVSSYSVNDQIENVILPIVEFYATQCTHVTGSVDEVRVEIVDTEQGPKLETTVYITK